MSLATHRAVAHSFGAGVEDHAVFLTSPEVLDFSLCREFWEAAQQVRDSEMTIIIDLSRTHAIHDSGYTLLWMLKDSLTKAPADLLLMGGHSNLKKMLQLRGFESHFKLL
ncbi:hypothetical protein [Nitrosococcus wardiae]|uniref:STAS domain-containing protein n=1 Tax=Nitrosococcus wardiae TaxID=1814290 RepID=A0A4P7C305_9GAMM|nr:hypothetical protein [Nitrosococcus wardiae]QBQ56097.1 hypothetical protein E3U44_17460 [Nitrosococcus wardiae]